MDATRSFCSLYGSVQVDTGGVTAESAVELGAVDALVLIPLTAGTGRTFVNELHHTFLERVAARVAEHLGG